MAQKREIDLVQLEKELNKQYYKEYMSENYKQKLSTLAEFSFLIAGGSLGIDKTMHSIYYPLSELLIASSAILYFIKEFKLKSIKRYISEITIQEIKKVIKESDEYKILNEEYQDYIFSLANFMSSQGITDGSEVAFLYQYMLDLGYLSYLKSHHYNHSLRNKKNMYNAHKYEIEDLWGCHVITGASVCRHMSSFLTDLEDKIGNHAYTMKVFSVDKNIPSSNYSNYIASHCISVIYDEDNNIFGYCPTNKMILSLDTKYLHDDSLANAYLSCSPILYNGICNDVFVAKDIENYNGLYDNSEINKIMNSNLFTNYKIDDLQNRKKNITKYIYKDNGIQELEEFYSKTFKKLEKMKQSIDYLMPLTDKKVKQLIIRK